MCCTGTPPGGHPAAWLLILPVFPALVLVGRWWRARSDPAPPRATGPVGHAVNLVVFVALYLTWWCAPAVEVFSDAALLFFGGSMLLAAARGYAGCEVLAVSNWCWAATTGSVAPRSGRSTPWRPVTPVAGPGDNLWRQGMTVELLLAPDCPNAPAARAVLAECLYRLGLTIRVRERVGEFPSPTILVDGVDVMTDLQGVAPMQACRLDVPTATRVLAALHGQSASPSTSESAA